MAISFDFHSVKCAGLLRNHAPNPLNKGEKQYFLFFQIYTHIVTMIRNRGGFPEFYWYKEEEICLKIKNI